MHYLAYLLIVQVRYADADSLASYFVVFVCIRIGLIRFCDAVD